MTLRLLPAILLITLSATGAVGADARLDLQPATDASAIEVWRAPAVDVGALRAEDARNRGKRGVASRVGARVPAPLTPRTHGSWIELETDRVWALELASPGALWLRLAFERFDLPDRAELRVRSADGSDVLRYDVSDVRPDGELVTPPLAGDSLRVELVWPIDATGRPEDALRIGHLAHGYEPWGPLAKTATLGGQPQSGLCNVNTQCPLGDDWQEQKQGVVLLLIEGGTGTLSCTGGLMNNTETLSNPGLAACRGLVLTADHCIGSQTAATSTTVVFNFERPSCEGGDASTNQQTTGTTLLANRNFGVGSDFSLVEVDQILEPSWEGYLLGWDRTTTVPQQSWGIHHPLGDAKKICHNENVLVDGPEDGESGGPRYWRVTEWEEGTTEQGSSGSPAFNEEQRVFGQLSFGAADCGDIFTDFESGEADFTTSTPLGASPNPWAITSQRSFSGRRSFRVEDQPQATQSLLVSPLYNPVPAFGRLSFRHFMVAETAPGGPASALDGGRLEYSHDQGPWLDAAPLFLEGGYNGTIDSASNGLDGSPAWSGTFSEFELVLLDVSQFAGDSLQFRWHFATDATGEVVDGGWHVDDVRIGGELWDEYGKLDAGWTGGGTSTSRLQDHLDPVGTGQETLDGVSVEFCRTPQPRLELQEFAIDDSASDGDGIAEPGETVGVRIDVGNSGNLSATSVTGSLSTSAPGVTVTDDQATWPTIAAAGEATSDTPHFTFELTPGFTCGNSIEFTLDLSSAEGAGPFQDRFVVATGNQVGESGVFSACFESGAAGFVSQTPPLATPNPWSLSTAQAACGTSSWFVPDRPDRTQSLIVSPQFNDIPANAYLAFRHFMNAEFNTTDPQVGFDAGRLEYRRNFGAWLDAGPLIVEGGYNVTIDGAFNPLDGNPGWSRNFFEFLPVRVDLADFEGDNLQFRWHFATDASGQVEGGGWYVDDVRLVEEIFVCNCLTDNECDDGVPCTVDSCNTGTGNCQSTPDDSLCDDGAACTSDVCDPQAGCSSTDLCDDGVGCTVDSCNLSSGVCEFFPSDGLCSDGVACTLDQCDPVNDCSSTPQDGACEDGDPCTVDSCTLSGCDTELLPDGDTDGVCDDFDNCPTDANGNQNDFDADGLGDVCETGAMVTDADLSGRVDGLDLTRMGRAFGTVSTDPNYDATVDFTRDGEVGGDDLAELSVHFGESL